MVIPHYGEAAPTLRLVAALRAQEPTRPERIIVSDDASPAPFPPTAGVEVVRRTKNGGFGSAVNSGMELVETPLALVLNSDLTVGPTFVHDLVAAAMPWQPAVVSPQLHDPSGVPQWVGRHFPTVAHQTAEWLTPLARFRHFTAVHEAVGHNSNCVDGTVVPVDWVVGAAMLLPVDEFRAVGGFDETFFMNAEEVDLQRRLRARGVLSVFVGTVTALHAGGASSDPALRRQWLVAGRQMYARKWGSERRLQAALAVASVANAAANAVRQLMGRDVSALGTLRRELAYLARKEA
ncbi:glycosyltransferase family 2 protein [Sinomonas susongensis]|uniref:glycosyltransferase family 2 protein n=1 Tax=Sinomonas susongensis TaxID=1324851 RepID=UPI002482C8CF|nr:glycosyltransferase family 2 protein [Sinomonas susongensis]